MNHACTVHILKYEQRFRIVLSPAQEITHPTIFQYKISNMRSHVKALDKNSRQMMDIANLVGFCLFQVKLLTPTRLYLQEWVDLTKRMTCLKPKLALRIHIVV